jgi:hypothetical protein
MSGKEKITQHPSTKQSAHLVDESLRCSFCNKSQDDVKKLIAGRNVFICYECIGICADIIAGDAQNSGEGRRWRERAAILRQEFGECSLCGKPALAEESLLIRDRGSLCGDCADAVEDALAQGKPTS